MQLIQLHHRLYPKPLKSLPYHRSVSLILLCEAFKTLLEKIYTLNQFYLIPINCNPSYETTEAI